MSYIGNQSQTAYSALVKQDITGNGGTGYTLSHPVSNENDILLYINNVKQEGGSGKAFIASGTTLTLSESIANTDSCYVQYIGLAIQTIVPPDGSVSTAKIANNAVNLTSKVTGILPLANGGTGATSLATGNSMVDIFTFHNSASAVQHENGDTLSSMTRDTTSMVGTYNAGMSESSGVWTFPSTGYYQVSYMLNVYSEAHEHNISISLYSTVDNGSNFVEHQRDMTAVDSGNASETMRGTWYLNISNTSTHKFKWTCGLNRGTKIRTGTTALGSRFYFVKLA